MSPIGFHRHNHTACVTSALAAADAACVRRKIQFTPTRRRVLELLLQDHKAMGAYDLLAKLDGEGLGSQPPVIYRALDFLVSNGFAHKIEKLNAYTACIHPDAAHDPAFMICRACDAVVETSLSHAALGSAAADVGFEIEHTVVEAEGLCPSCQETPAP